MWTRESGESNLKEKDWDMLPKLAWAFALLAFPIGIIMIGFSCLSGLIDGHPLLLAGLTTQPGVSGMILFAAGVFVLILAAIGPRRG